MQPGIYECLDNETYHSGPGESKSLLDRVHISPAHYRAVTAPAANDEPPRKSTPAQEFGTAFHALLLEPGVFVKNYCLALRPSDLPEPPVVSKDELLAMVEELNKGRRPKLPTSGSKAELAERILAAWTECGAPDTVQDMTAHLQSLGLAELKAELAAINEKRQGLLPTTSTIEVLAQLLRDAGRPVTLWQDVKAEWARNNGHMTVLEPEVWDQLHRMRDAVMAHPAASKLLAKAGVAEHSVFWKDPATGLLCRCRPDWWVQAEGILVDLKSCEDASPEGFARSIAKWRYHVQDPFYTDGIAHMQRQVQDPYARQRNPAAFVPIRAFLFLAVEKDARVVDGQAMGVAVYRLDDASRSLGRAEYAADLQRIAECKRAARFPGYGDAVLGIELPRWKLAQNQDSVNDAA